MNEKVKILLIEDNLGDAKILSRVLGESTSTKFEIIHADLLSTAIKYINEDNFDVILSDLSLTDSSANDTLLTLKAKASHLPIVILTGFDDEETAIKSVHEGIQDFIFKNQLKKESLVLTIRYAIERHKKELEQVHKEEKIYQNKLEEFNITEREKEVLSLLANGKSNEDIAKSLYLSLSTVRNCVGRIFTKLRVTNRAQATAIAVKAGLLNTNSIDASNNKQTISLLD